MANELLLLLIIFVALYSAASFAFMYYNLKNSHEFHNGSSKRTKELILSNIVTGLGMLLLWTTMLLSPTIPENVQYAIAFASFVLLAGGQFFVLRIFNEYNSKIGV